MKEEEFEREEKIKDIMKEWKKDFYSLSRKAPKTKQDTDDVYGEVWLSLAKYEKTLTNEGKEHKLHKDNVNCRRYFKVMARNDVTDTLRKNIRKKSDYRLEEPFDAMVDDSSGVCRWDIFDPGRVYYSDPQEELELSELIDCVRDELEKRSEDAMILFKEIIDPTPEFIDMMEDNMIYQEQKKEKGDIQRMYKKASSKVYATALGWFNKKGFPDIKRFTLASNILKNYLYELTGEDWILGKRVSFQ